MPFFYGNHFGPVHMEACRGRNWTHIEYETRVHSLDKQCMSNVDAFTSAAGVEFSNGKIFIPSVKFHQYSSEILLSRPASPAHMNRNQILYWDLGWGEISAKSSSPVSRLACLYMSRPYIQHFTGVPPGSHSSPSS